MVNSVTMSTPRLPSRSPKWPASTAPNGRNRKDRPTVRKLAIVAAAGPSGPNITWLNTRPATAA